GVFGRDAMRALDADAVLGDRYVEVGFVGVELALRAPTRAWPPREAVEVRHLAAAQQRALFRFDREFADVRDQAGTHRRDVVGGAGGDVDVHEQEAACPDEVRFGGLYGGHVAERPRAERGGGAAVERLFDILFGGVVEVG